MIDSHKNHSRRTLYILFFIYTHTHNIVKFLKNNRAFSILPTFCPLIITVFVEMHGVITFPLINLAYLFVLSENFKFPLYKFYYSETNAKPLLIIFFVIYRSTLKKCKLNVLFCRPDHQVT